jgi:hypothetical protein
MREVRVDGALAVLAAEGSTEEEFALAIARLEGG